MQKIATRIFIYASLAFGVVGLSLVLTAAPGKEPSILLIKLLFTTVFIILPSFALSVASKYLSTRS
jgi:hypothetical protein